MRLRLLLERRSTKIEAELDRPQIEIARRASHLHSYPCVRSVCPFLGGAEVAAVGYQVTDELGQTVRYEMLFGRHQVQAAEDRWKRLSLYARPLESI